MSHGPRCERSTTDRCRCECDGRQHGTQTVRERLGIVMEHGASAYNNHGCRCDDCRAGIAAKRRGLQARRRFQQPPASLPHGTLSTYQNWHCRCDDCRAIRRDYDRGRPARRKATA
jgi:hypothetical protein